MRIQIGSLDISLGKQRRARVREFGAGQPSTIEYVSDLLIQLEALQGSSTNRYVTRKSQVDETIRKYKGQATKGNVLTRNILETRAAFTIGKGLGYTGWDAGTPERKFVDEFARRNRFNLSYLRKLGRERCFEGQVLLVLNPSPDGVPLLRYISWADTGYVVNLSPLDYATIDSIRWDGRDALPIDPGRSSFMKFHCRLNAQEGTPLFAGVLNTLEDLDDALTLLKQINSAASNPTPYFKFAQEDDAAAFRDYLTSSSWSMGTALAGSGEATMIQIGYGPYTSTENHALLLVKILSGAAGVPPHYFGFSELLNNRAVADDIRAMYVTIGDTELDEWSQGFTDLLGRAMAMYNAQTDSDLKAGIGRVEVEQISEEQFRQVMAVWLPIWLGGGLSTETLLSKLPGIDEAAEAKLVIEELRSRHGQTPGELIPPERKPAEQVFRAYSQRSA